MNDADDWADLQDAWTAGTPQALPDVTPMIARARRQRQLILATIVAKWIVTIGGAAVIVAHWPRVQANALSLAWWVFFGLTTCTVLAVTTWTRIASLREPAGASLRDWLGLRRRRAQLGLRLARVTRWSCIAMLPAPAVALVTARPGWNTVLAVAAVSIILAAGWVWAKHRSARLTVELSEVDTLAREWLDEPR